MVGTNPIQRKSPIPNIAIKRTAKEQCERNKGITKQSDVGKPSAKTPSQNQQLHQLYWQQKQKKNPEPNKLQNNTGEQ
jgi:hypothetical protein